ncbi:MAG: bifunctional alpha,alpha-trehalose-phosphate synthase (UDP-forming)/trehalose-phosphatase [Candidatus Methanofastidiosum sp.]|nr:bifunctional alpha,alpha-trehalose-phosphate synthase (UDP-forming)/trehalose-phosphatase [Methanofastidiosum sp.]
MKRLLIVSNRLPITIEKNNEDLNFKHSVGGLATGLSSFYKNYDSAWIGWCGLSSDKINIDENKYIKSKLLEEYQNYPVFLSKKDIEQYYNGFCNSTLWPLFHGFTQYTEYIKKNWEAYKNVNEKFCEAICEIANNEDIIWVHDYHLMLLPKLIREKLPHTSIGFFLHIPFPSFEIYRLLPWRREILEGILEADLIGFHISDYSRHFLSGVLRILGYENVAGKVFTGKHYSEVDAFPMGIEYDKFSSMIKDENVQKKINEIREKIGEYKTIFSIDRLDYTKGILQRLEAYDYFLDKYPAYRGKVELILVTVPSRTKVEHYEKLKNKIDETVGKINGKYSRVNWTPIRYLYRYISYYSLLSLYNLSDVGLITPIRDGMNLIAKELIASKSDGKGVLILSEMAGASVELGEALIVNPNNVEEIADAIKKALEMPIDEQIERNRIMQKRLKKYNVTRWAEDFIEKLDEVKNEQKTLEVKLILPSTKLSMINSYKNSENRLFLLDYDGTLVPFSNAPHKALPDAELISVLKNLSNDNKNNVVIISGRDKNTLENWFKDINLSLIAEHGGQIKEKGNNWILTEPEEVEWKGKILPLLELYVDRTPGSLIESKELSLVWHYRKVDPELAAIRSRELKAALMHLTSNLNVGVFEGNKIIEVKNININKGHATSNWLNKNKWDFIVAIGDDFTDEDIFKVVPENAYSIKVGIEPSQAKYNVESYKEVRKLLKELNSLESND